MSLAQIIVTLSGLALSVFVIWFFFFSHKKQFQADANEQGLQEVNIKVKGGYEPDVIAITAGKPVRLNFFREEAVDCSEQVILPDFKKSAFLPPFETVSIEFTPEKPGEYDFTCAMGMLRGKLIVQ